MSRITAKDLPRECWLCGRNGNGDPLDAHHIFGGANRKLSEKYGLVVPLCHRRCHESGNLAAHRNKDTMRRLHEWGQRKAMEEQGWSIEEFRAVFGRNYLAEEPSSGPAGSLPPGGGDPAGENTGKGSQALRREEGFRITEEVLPEWM